MKHSDCGAAQIKLLGLLMKTMQLQSDEDTVGRVVCVGQATLSSILVANLIAQN